MGLFDSGSSIALATAEVLVVEDPSIGDTARLTREAGPIFF